LTEVDFTKIEELFWHKTQERLQDDKPISDTAMARMLEYFRARAEVRAEEAKALARAAEQAKSNNPIQTILSSVGLPAIRRIELLENERDNLFGELKRCEEAIDSLYTQERNAK
jgi:acyl-CoA synthetase (NDP forming)